MRKLLKRFREGLQPDVIGELDDKDVWPDCVAVGTTGAWWGSGTLVAPNVVISAAHVGRERTVTHVCFGPDTTADDAYPVPIIGSPVYYSDQAGDPASTPDLMVLILNEDIEPERAVPRPFAPDQVLDDPAVSSIKVVGYGGASPGNGTTGAGVRRKTDVPIASRKCDGSSDPTAFKCHPDYEVVGGREFLNLGACKGDSGGPAYVDVPGQGWMVAGVTRRTSGRPERACGDYSVHLRLDTTGIIEWIKKVPGGHWPPPP